MNILMRGKHASWQKSLSGSSNAVKSEVGLSRWFLPGLAALCNGEEGYEGSEGSSPGTEEAPPQGDEGGKGSEVSASPG